MNNRRRKLMRGIGGRHVTAFNRRRLWWGFLIIILLFAALVFRMGYWQIVRANDLNKRAAEMQRQDTEIDAVRGNIYDVNNKPLAQTVTKYELYGYTNNLYKSSDLSEAKRESNLKDLCVVTGDSEKEMKKKLTTTENLVKLGSDMSHSKISQAEKKWGSDIVIKTKVSRSYPNGDFASQLLGSVNDKNTGRTGLEYQYNSQLAGVNGRVVKTTDSQGNSLANGNSRYYGAKNGNSLVTTIDEVIQHYTEDAIATGMQNTHAESITCIVMNPKTGDVLAMAHTPGFDPNHADRPEDKNERKAFKKLSVEDQNKYLSQMWTNPAVSSVYEPGSTFKLITASSALDCGSTTSKSKYTCTGSIDIDGTTIKCWGAAHGVQNIKQAVGNSCNPALSQVTLDMGADRFYHYIDLYGLSGKTYIDLPNETKSIIKNKNGLSRVDLATTGFGQGIAVTPIELLTAINSIGNNGVLMRPKVVKKIVDADGKTVRTIKDKEVRQVISKSTADQMRDIMEYYVRSAGGTTAYIPGYRVGGKTGTAYIPVNGQYSDDVVASFVAMAPMDDPQVSMLVMVNKPHGGSIYGAANAGPIVKELMEKILVYKGVQRKYTQSESEEMKKTELTVPDVTNTDSNSAISKITSLGLNYTVTPKTDDQNSFNVADQYPKAGSKIAAGGTVYLYK